MGDGSALPQHDPHPAAEPLPLRARKAEDDWSVSGPTLDPLTGRSSCCRLPGRYRRRAPRAEPAAAALYDVAHRCSSRQPRAQLRRFSFLQHGQSVPALAVTPASLSAQPLWPVPAVPAATSAALRHRYSLAHRHRSCPSRRLQPPRRARRPRASAWLKGAKWRAAGETWAPQAKLWRKCTAAGLYFQRSGRHICPFVKRRSSEHFLFTQNR